MEGLYVRFKETDHPIWIRTHKFGMMKISNGFRSCSLRTLFTVRDAINAFKTAVAPDLDGCLITLHFESNGEAVDFNCVLAAIQLENTFQNPLYIKYTSPPDLVVSSIKSKNSDSVKYGLRDSKKYESGRELFLDDDSATDFNVPPTTTVTTPHRLIELNGESYFIAQCRAGDYVVHSWDPRMTDGYCGDEICFLLDTGYERTVKGPYIMYSSFQSFKALVAHGMPELNRQACKVTVGTLKATEAIQSRTFGGVSHNDRFGEIVHKDDEFSVEPISSRIRKEWYGVMYIKIEGRGGRSRFFALRDATNLEVEW